MIDVSSTRVSVCYRTPHLRAKLKYILIYIITSPFRMITVSYIHEYINQYIKNMAFMYFITSSISFLIWINYMQIKLLVPYIHQLLLVFFYLFHICFVSGEKVTNAKKKKNYLSLLISIKKNTFYTFFINVFYLLLSQSFLKNIKGLCGEQQICQIY